MPVPGEEWASASWVVRGIIVILKTTRSLNDEMLGSGHSSPSLPLTNPVPNPNTDPIPNPKLGLELGLVIFYVQKWEPGESG